MVRARANIPPILKEHECFSVCQFFPDGTYEYVRRSVTVEEALRAVAHYTNNPAAKIGITRRVIVTDPGDCICFEWKFGEGVVFPPPGGL